MRQGEGLALQQRADLFKRQSQELQRDNLLQPFEIARLIDAIPRAGAAGAFVRQARGGCLLMPVRDPDPDVRLGGHGRAAGGGIGADQGDGQERGERRSG